jgi:hypothetical protein
MPPAEFPARQGGVVILLPPEVARYQLPEGVSGLPLNMMPVANGDVVPVDKGLAGSASACHRYRDSRGVFPFFSATG